MYPRIAGKTFSTRTVVGLLGLCTLLLVPPAVAQDAREPFVKAVRSSPFDPPTEDVFVADDGAGLDTGCTFNDDPNHPLIIDILIDQAVGAVDGNGFLVDPGTLVADGVIPRTVEVILPAYDVDVNGEPPPENDTVSLNGNQLGSLSGDNGIWKLNSFSIDISRIKFPAPVTSGSPSPVSNRVQINIDTLSSGRWCTAIDWVALVIPLKTSVAFKLEPTVANGIRVRDEGSSETIDVIYEQSFDASCELTNEIDDYNEYPFSGRFGTARLHATLERCPSNAQAPEVKVDWKITGTSLTGVATWSGAEGDITLTMPDKVGTYDVELKFTVDDKAYPAINRKLFVTRAAPLAQVNPPRIHWYERATDWASGQSSESTILTSLLGGLYSFGQGNWRYGYRFLPGVPKCTWQQLASDPITCNFSDCHVFSEVFENMAATLGVGGLAMFIPEGSSRQGFLTSGAPSLDPAFPGNAKRFGTSTYDRYLFGNHNLRGKSSRYYDATFNGIYTSPTAFITANLTGLVGRDDGNYLRTAEGWKIYPLTGNVYSTWGNNAYKSPVPAPAGPAPVFQGLPSTSTTDSTDLIFTGNATFDLLDEDLNGLAEGLTADVEVQLNTPGEYTIFAILQKGEDLVANRPSWESMLLARATIDRISGTATVTLQFSGEQIYRSNLDGPYDLVLYAITNTGLASATLVTPPYDRTRFGEVPARLTGVSEIAVDTNGDGDLDAIDVTLDLDVRLASELRLQGALAKEDQTLADAGSVQTLGPGVQQVSLRFDGSNIRRSGLDGPYDGNVNLIDSTGHTIDSILFTTRPYPAGSFSALLLPQAPITDQGIDSNGNGLYDLLRVDFGAEVAQAGNYLLTGVLRSESSPSAVYTDLRLSLAAGPASLRLELPGPVINALGLDGPYTIDVIVRDAATLRDLDTVRLPHLTAAYLATQFDRFGASDLPIVLTGNSNDFGVDTNGNGLYDELRVDVEVSLAQTDLYEWGARLVDRHGTELGFYTSRATLGAGVSNLRFVYDGAAIGNNGVDGPYFVKSLLIFGSRGANLVSVDVAQTRSYQAAEFEGSGDNQPPQIVIATEPTVFWPSNHQHQLLAVTDFVTAVSDDHDSNVSVDDVVITRVTSDEAEDAVGGGDGKTLEDIRIATGCRSVELRAERVGGGNGRVYTIHVAARDARGNVGTASHTVIVPHDSSGGGAIGDGPAYTREGCAP